MRVIDGNDRLQPRPNGPLPVPESYESESSGPKLERLVDKGSGTLSEPVPVAMLVPNFSPIPRIAPPPLGSEIDGAAMDDVDWLVRCIGECSTLTVF